MTPLRCVLLAAIVLASLASTVAVESTDSLKAVLERMIYKAEFPCPEEDDDDGKKKKFLPSTKAAPSKETTTIKSPSIETTTTTEAPSKETSTTESPSTKTTTISYSESPQSLGHNMYTKPGSPDKKCYCEEVTDDDDDWSSGGGSSEGKAGDGDKKKDKEGSEGDGSLENKDDCVSSLQNVAVYEGDRDIQMNVKASHCAFTWTVLPTSDEIGEKPIVGAGCRVEKSLAKLYSVKESGLIVLKSTADGEPMSTAGLYTATCNGKKMGAKLLVIRTGPDCSCIDDSSSTEVHLKCSIQFADSTISPISAIFTWTINGQFYDTITPAKDKEDFLVYTATSTITYSGTVDDYQCAVAFGEPTVEYDAYAYVESNAPDLTTSCSTSCESA